MAKNVKRARGSNQYSEKLEAVPAEERRLPRKRRWGMSKSNKMMATPGKPFQCPSCGDLHPTGHMCRSCMPPVVGSLTCPGCGQAMAPSGAVLCDACEELALVPAGGAANAWSLQNMPVSNMRAMGGQPGGPPISGLPPVGPPAGFVSPGAPNTQRVSPQPSQGDPGASQGIRRPTGPPTGPARSGPPPNGGAGLPGRKIPPRRQT